MCQDMRRTLRVLRVIVSLADLLLLLLIRCVAIFFLNQILPIIVRLDRYAIGGQTAFAGCG